MSHTFNNKKNPQKGFTLIEVLLALTIGATLATTITLVTSAGLRNTRSLRRMERIQTNATFIADLASYWIKQGELFSISASPPRLDIMLPDSTVKSIELKNNKVTLNGAPVTSDDVRVTYLNFQKLAKSVRVGFALQTQGGPEVFSATTSVAQRNAP